MQVSVIYAKILPHEKHKHQLIRICLSKRVYHFFIGNHTI